MTPFERLMEEVLQARQKLAALQVRLERFDGPNQSSRSAQLVADAHNKLVEAERDLLFHEELKQPRRMVT